MHNLIPTLALGGQTAQIDNIGALTIVENADVSLASVSARMGREKKTEQLLKKILGTVPTPGQSQQGAKEAGFWMGPDQWMISAPMASHELLADQLKEQLGDAASVTEQTSAWVVFDITGPAVMDAVELLCAVPIRTMKEGETHRTVVHHLGCFITLYRTDNHVRLLGPRASAQSLHHAIITAAHSVA